MDEEQALLRLSERRAARALEKAPELAGYIRSLVLPGGSSVPTGTVRAPKADPPLPFRADAVDDADTLFGQLVNFADGWHRHLPVLPPEVITWRPDGGDVAGLPANCTVAGAQTLTWLVCRWLLGHHPMFLRLPEGPNYFEHVAQLVGGMRGRYPMAPRPPRQALPRPCPVCEEVTMVARIPQDVRDTEVVCENCGFVIPWVEFSDLVEGWLK